MDVPDPPSLPTRSYAFSRRRLIQRPRHTHVAGTDILNIFWSRQIVTNVLSNHYRIILLSISVYADMAHSDTEIPMQLHYAVRQRVTYYSRIHTPYSTCSDLWRYSMKFYRPMHNSNWWCILTCENKIGSGYTLLTCNSRQTNLSIVGEVKWPDLQPRIRRPIAFITLLKTLGI
jgi:hypothetical protein